MHIISYEPFIKEWEKLKSLKALQEEHKNNIIALRSTTPEYFIPKAFRFIFFIVLILALISIFANFNETLTSLQKLIRI